MKRALAQVALLTGKDLRIEARGRQTVGLMAVLGVLIIVVLGLGLGGQERLSAFSATTVLWVAYLFAGVLCFEKTMAVERNDAVLAALLMAPVDRSVLYAAKLLSNLALMILVVLVVTPVGVLLFGFDLSQHPLSFVAVMGLSIVGFAAVGTLFAAVVSSTRLQGGLLAMMVFPVTLPLVIVSTHLMLRQFRDGVTPGGTALGVLIAFDVIFITASWLIFEWALEP